MLIARLVALVVAEPGGGRALSGGPDRHPARHQWRLLLGGDPRVVSDWVYIDYLYRLIYYSVIYFTGALRKQIAGDGLGGARLLGGALGAAVLRSRIGAGPGPGDGA